MVLNLSIADFLDGPGVILDVRSPGEYAQGHLPGAKSLPLLSDTERAQVGTCYKQQGRDQAVELGFAIVGPQFVRLIQQAKALAPDQRVYLYCWRGGLRSNAVAWVLETAGMQVSVLVGGYKAFRRWVRSTLALPRKILLLGGMTGTGKTDILRAIAAQGAQMLDLEQLANHRGSSYGALGLPPQPSTEQFENLIAMRWAKLNPQAPVWIEAESRRIGICRIPEELFKQMEQAIAVEIIRPLSERLSLLVEIYGSASADALVAATERIRKRLGGLRTQQAIQLIQQGQLAAAFAILLDYYDRTYRYDLERRQRAIPTVDMTGLSAMAGAKLLTQKAELYLSSSDVAL
ncbi:MAG: tRNA 2-selenouridine(34) synthase MnmH [Cyanothece sp. SIO1E1]|nr:tRNA 2-selenouridine(34) synthase MnmH [Cyanothece sp. SIO1E1]